MSRINLAAMLASIRAGQTIESPIPDEQCRRIAGAMHDAVSPALPTLPPLLACGCDGTGWRPMLRLDGRGYYCIRCLCWHRKHPRPTPAEPKKFRRSRRDRIHDTRSRQFRDD